jgi:hypothetical protein
MQLDCHPIPIDLMHNQVNHKVKLQNKRQGHWLDALGLALITTMLDPHHLMLVYLRTTLGLALLEFLTLAPHDLSYIQMMANLKMCNAWEQRAL